MQVAVTSSASLGATVHRRKAEAVEVSETNGDSHEQPRGLTFELSRSRRLAKPAVASRLQRRVRQRRVHAERELHLPAT
jgi:hypothetical protein